VHRDFQEYVNAASRLWDIIFIGFSFHHLNSKAKLAFASQTRRVLSAGGEWIFFEPGLDGNEKRKEFLIAGRLLLSTTGKGSLPRKRQPFGSIFRGTTFPENLRTFERIALEGGFRTFEHVYTDPSASMELFARLYEQIEKPAKEKLHRRTRICGENGAIEKLPVC
jgi:hypothetical protein